MKLVVTNSQVSILRDYTLLGLRGGEPEILPGRNAYELKIEAVFTSGLNIKLDTATQDRLSAAIQEVLTNEPAGSK